MGVGFKCDGAILFAAAEQMPGNEKIERRCYDRGAKTDPNLLLRLWRIQPWHRRPDDDGRRKDNQRPFSAAGKILGFTVAEGVNLIWRPSRND